MKKLIEDLRKNIEGGVFSACGEDHRYQKDESIFSITPRQVVCPKTVADVQAVVEIAKEHKVSITARGAGTGVAGQAIGEGIVVDFSKWMNQILDVNHIDGDEIVTVEPGVVLADLQKHLAQKEKWFAPNPGSWDRCTMGGMIATNAAGSNAMAYGSTRDHVESVDLVLADGKQHTSLNLPSHILKLHEQMLKHKDAIEQAQPRVEKNSSGYDLTALVSTPATWEKLLVGSEGTLGLITQARLRTLPKPQERFFASFGFVSTKRALAEVMALRETKPICIELLNDTILQMLEKVQPELTDKLGLRAKGGALWVEWHKKPASEVERLAEFFTTEISTIDQIWAQRSKISPYLHRQAHKQSRHPLRCIEDACVPLSRLTDFYDELICILMSHDAEGAIFGHAGSGHLHVNPGIRVDIPRQKERVEKLMADFYELVKRLGGTISGEHGDGILRTKYAKRQWAPIWHLFQTVKTTFDPSNLFNPGKKM